MYILYIYVYIYIVALILIFLFLVSNQTFLSKGFENKDLLMTESVRKFTFH